MLNFFSIVLIIFILISLLIFKRRYIFNAFNKKNVFSSKSPDNENKKINASVSKKYINYHTNSSRNSEFYKRNLRKKMFKLSKGSTKDKLKALKIAEELADKSTLPIIRKCLKDMNLEVVQRSADLIRKFK